MKLSNGRILLTACTILITYSAYAVDAFRKITTDSPSETSNFSVFHFQAYSKNTNCTFHQTTTSKKSLSKILLEAPDILYIHAVFDDPQYQTRLIEKSAKDIVLPQEWQLAGGIKGLTLLRFPYMFISMSLWTLSPGVFKTTIRFENINQSCPSFFDNDIDLNQHLRESIRFDINQTLSVTDRNEVPNLCQETFQITNDEDDANIVYVPVSFGNIISILYDRSNHACSPVNIHLENSTNLYMLTNSQWLQNSTYFASILLSMFFPMVLLLCQHRNPPRIYDSFEYLQTTTDLPIGFRHMLCYWTNDGWLGKTMRFLRLFISLVLMCFALYPEIILVRLFDAIYEQRIAALKRLTLKSCIAGGCYTYTYQTFTIIVIATSVPLALELIYIVVGCMARNENVLTVINQMCCETKYERMHLFPLFKLSKANRIPKHSDNISDGQSTFMYYTKARMCLMLNCQTWKQLLEDFKQLLSTVCVKPIPRWCHPIVWVLSLPFFLIYISIVIIFNMLPGGYLIYRFSKTIHLANRRTTRFLLFTYNMFISVILLYRLYYFIYLCALTIVLVFTGIIINSSIVNPYCVFVLTLTGFVLSSIVGIHDTYQKLLKEIIKQVVDASKFQSNLALKHTLVVSSPEREQNLPECMDDQFRLVYRHDGDVHLSIKIALFWFVVEKCKPLRVQVVLVLLQITIAFAAVIIAILVLKEIQELAQLSSASVTLTTLIASYAVPKIMLIIKSESTRKQEKEILYDRIHMAILEYRRRESGEAVNDGNVSSDSEVDTDRLYDDESDDEALIPI